MTYLSRVGTVSNDMSKGRDLTLDLAKGILIILVVLGHSIQYSYGLEYSQSDIYFENPVFRIIYCFHMPMFMLISGYLFCSSNKKQFRTVIGSKLRAIGIPMISFIILYSFIDYVGMIRTNPLGIVTSFLDSIVRGWIMWFLFSILLNMFVVAVLTRISGNRIYQYLMMFALFVISLFIPDAYLLSVHKFMFPFFCLGYAVNDFGVDPYKWHNKLWMMVLLTLASILAVIWFDTDTYIYTTGFCITGKYSSQLYIDLKRMVVALIVSITFIQYVHLLSKKVSDSTGILARLGQKSLFIYGVNILSNRYYPAVLLRLNVNLPHNPVIPVAFTLVFIAVAYLCYKLLDKNKVTGLLLLGKNYQRSTTPD